MSKSRTEEKLSVTRFEVAKRILVFAGLTGCLLLSVVVTRSNPRTGWFGVLLFGVMTSLAAFELAQVRNYEIVRGEGVRANVRTSLIWSGTFMVAVFLGLLERLLSSLTIVRVPLIGVWLATFVTTLAFYPFRGEQKQDLPTFKIWVVYCALMGVVSLGMSYVFRWLH